MKKIIAYTSIEQIVVGDYKFNCEEYNFYDNPVTAKEDIEDFKEDNELTYVAKVEIIDNLFNIYNPIHRKKLFSSLPKYVTYHNNKYHKEVLILSLMGKWFKDDNNTPLEENLSTNEIFNEKNLKYYIKNLNFNGYVSMFEQLSQYTVFNPDIYVNIINLSL